jgi:hypothetical protein
VTTSTAPCADGWGGAPDYPRAAPASLPAQLPRPTVYSAGPVAPKTNRQPPYRAHSDARGNSMKQVARFAPRSATTDTLLIRAIRTAFPGQLSVKARAEKAAPFLGITPRQVENILNGRHDGKSLHLEWLLFRLMPVIGIEKLAQLIEGRTNR